MLQPESNAVFPLTASNTSIHRVAFTVLQKRESSPAMPAAFSSWKEGGRRGFRDLGLGVIRETVCHSSCQFRIRMKSASGESGRCAWSCRDLCRSFSLFLSDDSTRLSLSLSLSLSALVTPSRQRETAGSSPRCRPVNTVVADGFDRDTKGRNGDEGGWNRRNVKHRIAFRKARFSSPPRTPCEHRPRYLWITAWSRVSRTCLS